MKATTVKLNIFSPRWGHEDTYGVNLTENEMLITQGGRTAKCTSNGESDPIWSIEPLEKILNNDHIYPPSELEDLLEYAWQAWKDGKLTDAEVDTELQAVANWINTMTKAKPNTTFWSSYF